VYKNRLAGILLRAGTHDSDVGDNVVRDNVGSGIVLADGSYNNVVIGNTVVGNQRFDVEVRRADDNITVQNLVPPLIQLSPGEILRNDVDYKVVHGNADVIGRLVPIDIALQLRPNDGTINRAAADSSTSGCQAKDFEIAGFRQGDVALVQRGTCMLEEKRRLATGAGASGVIVFNEGQSPDRQGFDFGTALADENLAAQTPLPVIFTTAAVGIDLYQRAHKKDILARLQVHAPWSASPGGFVLSHHNILILNTVETALIFGCDTNQVDDALLIGCVSGDSTTGGTTNAY
jgi:parallel beta-helix repeat protein